MSGRAPLLTAGLITVAAVAAATACGVALLAVLGYTVPAETGTVPAWSGGVDAAAAAAARKASTPDDPAAVALLAHATTAATSVAYEGLTVSSGTGPRPTTRARITALPGVGTVVEGAGGALVLAGEGRSASLADATAVLGLLADNYRVVRAPASDREVAGRSAVAVEALRPDGSPAARFWLDRGCGLLLRRDLVSRSGTTFATTSFEQLRLGGTAMTHLPPLAADPWSHVLDEAAQQEWRAAGCSCQPVLAGGLTLLQARTDDAGAAAGPGKGVVHLLYSDGITEVSLFDQPGRLGAEARAQLQQQGFTSVTYAGVEVLQRIARPAQSMSTLGTGEWVWQAGSSVLTLVGPASPRAAAQDRTEQIVAALSPAPAAGAPSGDGPVAAVQRGWSRLVTAVRESWEHLT